jgi:L-fucose mutarotase
MLKNIHPLLHADLLHALAAMGHGDELVIVDANFPAASVARRMVHLPVLKVSDALEAVLTVFPIDAVTPAALTMKVAGDSGAIPDTVREFSTVLEPHMALSALASLEREAFYERARHASAVVRTAELRPYGNILLVKGVVNRYPAS